jgi:sugar lactone lactonase YvrE
MDCATPNPDSPFSENPDHFKCEEYEFACHTGHCIHKQWVCDGDADCPDHSDELNCTKTCAPGQFRCREDDICLSLTKKCDRERDCPDGSDEEPGMCQFASYHVKPHGCDLTVEFDCENEGDESKCVRYDQVCDGNYDCPHIQGFPQSMDEDVDLCKMITKVHCEEPFGKGGCKNKDLCRKVGNRGAICSCEHGYYLHNYTDCKDINECEIPGTCNQVCENEVGSYRCSCYKNYILQKDGKTCRALGAQRPQLLLSNRVNIRKINPETKEYLPVIEKLHSAVAMDYLYEKYLFWSDVASEKIYRCKHENLDKTKKHLEAKDCEDTLVEKDISTPDGLAVDWIHGLLFWTDTGKNTISVLHIERKHRMTLFNEGIDEPRAIAVDPKAGVIFWTDWGKIPKIERSGMSGKGRVTIVDHNVAWPNGLAVDMLAQRIYWADAKLKMISTAKYDGSEARVIIQSFITLKHPFSLSVFEDRIYWTDWDTEGVHSANRFTGKDVQHVATGLYGPMTVRVYHQHSQPRSANKCYNHKCSHLCLPNSHIHDAKENVTGVREFGSKWQKGKYPAFICACPDTHRLHDDEKTCNEMDGPHSASRERQTGSITLMTIGIISGVAILVAVIGWVVWRRTGGSPLKNLNFDNPVYRQTVVGVDSNVGYDHLKVDMDPDTYAEPTIHLGPGPAGGSAVYNPGAAGSSSATASLTENEII